MTTLEAYAATGLGSPIPWDEPKPDDIVYRQSTREALALCGGRVLLGQEDRPPSEAMSFGTLVHKMIEMKILGEDSMLNIRPFVRKLWTGLLAEEGHDIDVLSPSSLIDKSVEEAIRAVEFWVEDFWLPEGQYLHAIGVEVLRLLPLGVTPAGNGVWLQGTPDLVVSGNRIIDFKTAGRGWNEGKHLVRVQAPLYTYMEREAGTVETPTAFDFQVFNRQSSTWDLDSHSLVVTDRMIDAALEMAWTDALAIEAGALPFQPYGESYGKFKRGWHCSAKYCGAWDKCSVKYLIEDGNADLEHDPRWG